jgi:hypothetical protein
MGEAKLPLGDVVCLKPREIPGDSKNSIHNFSCAGNIIRRGEVVIFAEVFKGAEKQMVGVSFSLPIPANPSAVEIRPGGSSTYREKR